jgi:colicin import membrane protein
MPPRKSLTTGRWRAIAWSLLLHSAIVAAAVYGWFSWKHKPPPQETLAIEATVVDERALKNVAPKPTPPPVPEPEPEPEPPPPEEQGPPAPDPAEIERRQEQERLEAEKRQQEQAEQQKQEQEKLEREKQAQEQQRLEAEKEAAAKAAAQKAAEKAAAEKAAAEKKAAEKKKAEEAAAARKAAEEKARQASEEELRKSLEAEERVNAARNSSEAARWHATIVARIERAWIKPPTALPGTTCIVIVNQVPGNQGGEVTSADVRSCTPNDAALRESVRDAVLRASPLPPPPAGVPFERNLELTFAPK